MDQDDVSDVGVPIGLSALIFGIIVCFFGLRLFKCVMYVMGFCIGFGVGAAIVILITDIDDIGPVLFVGLVVGIIGGYVMVFLRKVVYFLFGVSLGGSVSMVLNVFFIAKNVDDPFQALAISTIILGLAGGILAVYIGDLIVIITTAVSGSSSIAFGTMLCCATSVLTDDDAGGAALGLFIEFLYMAGLGIWYQLRKREQWKAYLNITNNVNVNTNVNTNVNNENKIEIKIEQPLQQYPGMMYPQQGYSVPFMQAPYGQNPNQQLQQSPGQPDQQYAQLQQMYSQPQMYQQQPGFQQQPEFAKPQEV